MATLTGSTIANSYKQLLQVGSNNTGLTGTVQTVQDGSGTNSGLQLSNSTVNINGTFQLNGVTLTANASTLNNLADLTGVVGLVAVSGGEVNGRTLTAGAGIAITNGDGTEGNPTIAVSLEDTTINVAKVSASIATFNSIVSAAFFVGDGSGLINVPSAEGGTVKFIEAGTGIKITVDGAVSSSIPVSGTILVSADQNFGTVSVSTALAVTGDLLISGVTAATVNDVAAVSALTQTNLDSITSINTVVANVSALTSVNAAAITSINTVVDNLDFATSAELAAVSVLTQTNLDSITSINVVVANVSALTSINAAAITSINAVIEGNVSADSGTFNTLTVITSASIGGTLNVGGNVSIGGDLTAGATTVTTLTASGLTDIASTIRATGASSPASGAGVEINYAGGGGAIQTYNRGTGAYGTLDVKGSTLTFKSGASATTALTIDSSQNVGIGTSSPSAKLDVVGAATFAGNVTLGSGATPLTIDRDINSLGAGQSIVFQMRDSGSANQDYAQIQAEIDDNTAGSEDGTLRFKTREAGSIVTPLELAGSNATFAGDVTAGVNFNLPTTGRVEWDSGLWIRGTTATDTIDFITNGATALTIDSSQNATFAGDVGIGTIPAEPLHVEGDTNGATIRFDRASNNQAYLGIDSGEALYLSIANKTYQQYAIEWNGGNDYHTWSTGGASQTERMRITTSGDVGIGTSIPSLGSGSSGLHIKGTQHARIKLESGADDESGIQFTENGTDQWRIVYDALSNHLEFTESGVADRMVIQDGGNVGIGTSSPAKQLHITKAAKADIGTLTDGATITPDFDANQNFSVTLGGNRTLANPSNIDAGQTGSIFVVQDGTGSRTLSFGSYWKFAGGTAPTLSTAAGAVDRIDYIVYTTTAIHAVATLNVS